MFVRPAWQDPHRYLAFSVARADNLLTLEWCVPLLPCIYHSPAPFHDTSFCMSLRRELARARGWIAVP